MPIVILSIDGEEVYKSSQESSAPNTTKQYTVVKRPYIGSEYYYQAGYDEDNNPVYKNGKLTEIKSVQEGMGVNDIKYIYFFDNGDTAEYTIYKPVTSGGGGNPEEENYESREKKEYLPERNFEYN